MKIPGYLKNAFRLVKWTIISLLSCLALYLLLSLILSIVPVNRGVKPSGEIDIYLVSNGVHLDIVLPLRSELKDWTEEFLIDSTLSVQANYISFGWGDRNFYINTPNWSDLTLKTAVRAIFLKSATAMHINYYSRLVEDENCIALSINEDQYLAIVDYVENSLTRDVSKNVILIEGVSYTGVDSFYEATKSYHLFFTCNTWTNTCLKKAGLKASLWTPLDKGTLFHYR